MTTVIPWPTPTARARSTRPLNRADAFWMHPIPRRYDDPLRTKIREFHGGYAGVGRAFEHKSPSPPLVNPSLAHLESGAPRSKVARGLRG